MTAVTPPQIRKWWGWGYEVDGVDDVAFERLFAALRTVLGDVDLHGVDVNPIEGIKLRPSRFALPGGLAVFTTDRQLDRIAHAYGKAYVDLIRAVTRDVSNPPDYVAYPRTEAEIADLIHFCEGEAIAVTPYGGGSSVVGGVEPPNGDRFAGAISVDLRHLDSIVAVDEASHLAHVEAGTLGPALEARLKPAGLSLRHYPQSFEFSSVGGWIATRAAGHYATGPTHIDDLVAGARMLSPRGVVETVPHGYAGGGPAPEGLILGSEGTLGVIVSAWLRVHVIPTHRANTIVRFRDPAEGVEAVRAIVQAGLSPAHCRLVSPAESAFTGLGDGRTTDLVLGFESADRPIDELLDRALRICEEQRGATDAVMGAAAPASAPYERWRRWFLQAPYLRDRLALRGLVVETFETASTWSAFGGMHRGILQAVQAAVDRECGRGIVTWRLAYAYPDGVAPYYTVVAVADHGREVEQWTAIKAAASDAIEANGGTTTHHHGIGRTHATWIERERGPLFMEALAAVKRTLDPSGIMNPGVLGLG